MCIPRISCVITFVSHESNTLCREYRYDLGELLCEMKLCLRVQHMSDNIYRCKVHYSQSNRIYIFDSNMLIINLLRYRAIFIRGKWKLKENYYLRLVMLFYLFQLTSGGKRLLFIYNGVKCKIILGIIWKLESSLNLNSRDLILLTYVRLGNIIW